MANLNDEQLRRLARLGAVARLEQIKDEETAIRAEFPELFGTSAQSSGRGRGRRRGRPPSSESAGAAPAATRRRRRPMSSAARRAVSVRMKKYWADRRKAKAAGR